MLLLAFATAAPAASGAGEDYYLNRTVQSDGDQEVHRESCRYVPGRDNRIHLGRFESCEAALRAARKHTRQADGCYYCARSCDTG